MFESTNTNMGANYTKGLLLLALTVMGNFVAETLGCSTQKLLTKNRLAKHLVILFLIYFTLNITNNESVHPLHEIKMTFILFVCFIIFTKMSTKSTVIVFSALCLHYILGNFKTYYSQNNIHGYNDIFNVIDKGLIITIAITTVIGFVTYLLKERREHKNFNLYKFFIGVDSCRI